MGYLEEAIRKSVGEVRPVRRPTEYVYIFTPDVFSGEKKYKIGSSKDWVAREKGLRTACPSGRMAFVLPCASGKTLESRVFQELKNEPDVHVVGEVVFGLDVSVLRNLVTDLGKVLDNAIKTPAVVVAQELQVADSTEKSLETEEAGTPMELAHVPVVKKREQASPEFKDDQPASPAHSREKLLAKKDTSPNEFYYRYLDDESTKKRGPWEEAELRLLRQVIASEGAKHWGLIARKIPGRVGYQCRGAYNGSVFRQMGSL